jgi:hypothetical protein
LTAAEPLDIAQYLLDGYPVAGGRGLGEASEKTDRKCEVGSGCNSQIIQGAHDGEISVWVDHLFIGTAGGERVCVLDRYVPRESAIGRETIDDLLREEGLGQDDFAE